MNTIDSRTVIPLNGYTKSSYIPTTNGHSRKHVNGHLPTIAEHKPIANGHVPTETSVKQPIQFVTPTPVELRTSA